MAKRKYKLYIALIIIIIFYNLSNAYGGEFVGVFSKEKEIAYPFSGFEGRLLYKGEPAVGAIITRTYNQMDKGEVEEIVIADDDGRFAFDSVSLDFKLPVFSNINYISRQNIFVKYKNENFKIWRAGKRSKDEFSEFNGRPKNFTCELTSERKSIRLNSGGFVGTNCMWDN